MKPGNLMRGLLIVATLTGAHAHAQAAATVQVQEAWRTSAELQQPESVVFDAKRNILYVSNVSGEPLGKDGQGFISRVSPDGKIVELRWIEGMNAPKGMAIHGDTLYVSDIDTLIEIDLDTGKISRRHPVSGAKFLNDVAADQAGNIYVSDMQTDTIYRLKDGRIESWLKDAALAGPNGLYAEGEHLVLGAWGAADEQAAKTPGHLKRIDLKTKRITSIGSGKPLGNLDGVEGDGQGNYFVTDWVAGTLLHVTGDGTANTLQVLAQGSADLEYIADRSLLIIPMMNDNRLLAFTVRETGR